MTKSATATPCLNFLNKMETEIKRIITDSFGMRYFCFGSGDKALVILPGLSVQSVMDSADAVEQQYADMAQEFTIYVFDRRETLPDEYGICDMALDTAKAIDALGLKDLYLFGASQGGMIAIQIAIERPEMIKKLVLGSTAARVTAERFAVLNKWIELAKQQKGRELYLSFGEAIYPKAIFEQYIGVLGALGETVTADEFRRFITLANGAKGFDAVDRLAEIQCPVFVIGAADDKVLGEKAAQEIAEKLKEKPDFRLHIYDGYGHAAFDTAPDYRQRMMDFF